MHLKTKHWRLPTFKAYSFRRITMTSPSRISAAFALLLVATTGSVTHAATINFDNARPFGNYDPVPAGFGSTDAVNVSYSTLNVDGTTAYSDVLLWNTGYASLNTAAFAHANGLLLNITLSAVDPGQYVTLNHFDVAAYPGPNNFTQDATDLRIVDGNNVTLADYAPGDSSFPVPGDLPYTFTPNISAHSISIILGGNWNNGVNNIEFTTSPVPLPSAAWLMLSGFGGLCTIARKKKAV